MATLNQISQMTGLAPTTVSEILRGKRGYSEETCRRVRWVAEQLQYRPNPLSRALKGGRSMSIGLVHGGGGVPINAFKVIGIEGRARAEGYAVLQASVSDPQAIDPVRELRDLLDRRVDGLLVYHVVSMPEAVQRMLDGCDVPVVYLDACPRPGLPCVRINRAAGMREAADHLAKLGHRRVGFVPTPTDLRGPHLKIQPYHNALAEVGIELVADVRWVLKVERGFERSIYDLFTGLIQNKQLPSAMLMNNDEGALAALAAIHDAGWRVPEDVSIIGFDDLPFAEFVRPALTTVHQPRGEAGQAAFDLLLQLMQKNQDKDQNPAPTYEPMVFPSRLVVRGSTGPVRPA